MAIDCDFVHLPGKELVSAVGAEVDRLEANILKIVPGVVHVDLEVDRGKVDFFRKRAQKAALQSKNLYLTNLSIHPADGDCDSSQERSVPGDSKVSG